MLVHHFVEFHGRNTPDLPCFTYEATTMSYAEVDAAVNRFANLLIDHGVAKGQRVAVLGENSIEHALLFLAASKVGAVSVPLNSRLAPTELAFIIADADVRVLLVRSLLDSTVLDSLRTLMADDVVVITGELSEALAQYPATAPELAVEVDRDDAYTQLYTSGTTGNPKGVVLSHFNLLQAILVLRAANPSVPDIGSAALLCAPMFHIGGGGAVVGGIYGGQHTIIHRAFDPVRILDDIETYPVTSVFLVPAMIMAILQVPDVESRDFSKLGAVLYGASPITESALARAVEVFGCDFVQLYGMTETTGTVTSLSPADHRRALAGRPGLLRSCGRPTVGAHIKVVATDGVEVPVGEVGEIWAKADTNMLGYHNLPEETAACLTDGWVHTGDAGSFDDDGYLYLKDRIKDMVVSGGENIYPVEVENVVARHEAVADVAVIGVPDDTYGEALLAFVVTEAGAGLEVADLIEFCRDKIAGYKIPRRLEVVDELPRNPSGKVLKKILRAPYWSDSDRSIG